MPIVMELRALGGKYHRYLHQDELGPSRAERMAALRVLISRFDRPSSLLDELPKDLRLSLCTRLAELDPAGKSGANNDYTAITIVGVQEKALHLLYVSRGHWTVMQMQEQITALAAQWKVDLIIIEDTASGMGLKQILWEHAHLDVIGRQPDTDKETRLCRHQGRFEAGRILLPVEAPWLADFEAELLAFPHGRYDDQVDALLLFLDWYAQNEQYIHPLIVCVPDLSRPNPWPNFEPDRGTW